MSELLSREELEAIKQRVALAFGGGRGELLEYCLAHDYGDPGYPPDECAYCVFERDWARRRLATIDVPRLLRHIDALERKVSTGFFDRTKDRYHAYREYAEAVIESQHTYVELQLAEMVLDLLEAVCAPAPPGRRPDAELQQRRCPE